VTARGDLNGDGVPSTFSLTGHVRNGAVVLEPLVEDRPEEWRRHDISVTWREHTVLVGMRSVETPLYEGPQW
jgi:hypothetical protein